MKNKECIKCGKVKPLIDFYKHKKMADGFTNKCKSCTKYEVKKRTEQLSKDPEWLEKERARGREKYKRLGYKEKHKRTNEERKIANENYKNKYPEKMKGKNSTSNMKPKIKGNQLHHWSYNDEHLKDVIELSTDDHYFLHRYIRYDQPSKMYKTLDGRLLDTKEKHVEYFEIVIQAKDGSES